MSTSCRTDSPRQQGNTCGECSLLKIVLVASFGGVWGERRSGTQGQAGVQLSHRPLAKPDEPRVMQAATWIAGQRAEGAPGTPGASLPES